MTDTLVFYVCEAYVCQVLDEKKCRVWLRPPSELTPPYDPAQTFDLDLDATPSRHLATAQVDDYIVPKDDTYQAGLTTLGPSWPYSGSQAAEGCVCLVESVWKQASERRVIRWPLLPGALPYRWQHLLLCDDPAGRKPFRRYAGVHAHLVSRTRDDAVFVVWMATEDYLTDTGRIVKVNLGNPDHVAMTHSDDFQTPGTAGKLFLRWKFLGGMNAMLNKIPLGEGTAAFPGV